MTKNQANQTEQQPTETCPDDTLTDQQQADRADAATQKRYREAYLAQFRQQQCPGCTSHLNFSA